MDVTKGTTSKNVLERAVAIAAERGGRATTLHLAAALFEHNTEGTKQLTARGVRAEDLRSAGKVHREDPGTLERVHSLAKRIAAARSAQPCPSDLLIAALGDRHTALASMVAQLGADPTHIAQEVLRQMTAPRSSSRPTAPTVSARTPAPTAAIAASAPRSNSPNTGNPARAGIISARTQTQASLQRPVINAPGGSDAPIAPKGNVRTDVQKPTSDAIGSSPPQGTPATRPGRLPPPAKPARVERTEHDLDPRTFPALALCARNLSADNARGTLDPVVAREREVRRVLDALGRREGRGALIVGAAGVGKSTLLRAIAREPNTRVLSLRHAEVAAHARGQQGSERARKLVEELLRAGEKVVVALDPVAPWFLTRDVPDEVVLELRAALAAGKLAWVGTATPEETRKLLEIEPWIERAALRVELEEPAGEALKDIVRAFAPAISQHHGVVAEAPVLERAAELSERYLGGRAQPDRALGVIDLALARARRGKLPALNRQLIAEVVAELGGLPTERVASTDHERLLALEQTLASRLVGHREALKRVAAVLRRNAVGFRGNRPIGTFLFLGPTGVGKTEAAKAIAEALFPGSGAMTRIDMAEYSEAHAVARLVGAPPGYVGYADGGQLTEAVRKRPYQLVLLDEIEKAHRDVLESLLALLDEGRMTDGRGRTTDFRNTVIVMTTNLGAEVFRTIPVETQPVRRIGFAPAALPLPEIPSEEPAAATKALETARAALPPELWNRIDEPLVFGALSRDEVREIAWRLLTQTFARLAQEQGIRAEPTAPVVEFLLDNGGFEPALGARPMRRAIARLVEAPMAEAVLRGTLRRGDTATLFVRDWGLEVQNLRK